MMCGMCGTIVLLLAAGAAAENGSSGDAEDWAFRPPGRAVPPAVRPTEIVRNPIDSFILARLEAKGIQPVGQADKRTLLRRLSFDLAGLPPAPEEIESFLSDPSPDAVERRVDRLLASPRHGERWARHWLDIVRYADSNGFKSDVDRPYAFRYRDYVIGSFNADKPYDRFVMEQVAGDELLGDADALIATGFLRHYPDEDNARNLPQRRQEILDDITDVVGSALLGLTFHCARCHDHKYDPILQEDYFRLQAFFAGFEPLNVPLAHVWESTAVRHRLWETKTQTLRAALAQIEADVRASNQKQKMVVFPLEVQEAVRLAPQQRTPLQQQLAHMVQPQIAMTADELAKKMNRQPRWSELMQAMEHFKAVRVDDSEVAMAFSDIGRAVPPSYLLRGGSFGQNEREVAPGFPSFLGGEEAQPVPLGSAGLGPHANGSSGRRRELARWLANPDHPLLARVIANRLWHHHFGRGIVENPSDFGVMGLGPSHPELLDWLAGELVRHGQSLKSLHRTIVTSAAYRRSSQFDAAASAKDVTNDLWWRQNRRRLEAEVVRDSMLWLAGSLDRRMGGPGVFPPIPKEVEAGPHWPVSPKAADHARRSIYLFVRRNINYPMLGVLDQPNANLACAKRDVTTTAPQALLMLNSNLTLGFAADWVSRLHREAGPDEAKMIDHAFRLAYARPPRAAELAMVRRFLDDQSLLAAGSIAASPSDCEPEAQLPAPSGAALVDFCHALLNTNEFLYVD